MKQNGKDNMKKMKLQRFSSKWKIEKHLEQEPREYIEIGMAKEAGDEEHTPQLSTRVVANRENFQMKKEIAEVVDRLKCKRHTMKKKVPIYMGTTIVIF